MPTDPKEAIPGFGGSHAAIYVQIDGFMGPIDRRSRTVGGLSFCTMPKDYGEFRGGSLGSPSKWRRPCVTKEAVLCN